MIPVFCMHGIAARFYRNTICSLDQSFCADRHMVKTAKSLRTAILGEKRGLSIPGEDYGSSKKAWHDISFPDILGEKMNKYDYHGEFGSI